MENNINKNSLQEIENLRIHIDSNNLYERFKILCKTKYFVDKTKIIKKFNELLYDTANCICITKPRRFGKSAIASMIVAYYSKSRKEEFKEIFENLKISKEVELKETMGKYHTIFIDFSRNHRSFNNLKDYLSSLECMIIDELKNSFVEDTVVDKINKYIEKLNRKSDILAIFLECLYSLKRERFIFVIDEWDYMFSHDLYTIKERDDFLNFLRELLKDKAYVAFTYMTGVLPIAKRSPGTSLNCFMEYSILVDYKYYEYFGLTEKEVEDLCKKNGKLKFDELNNWYNGYILNGVNIFNTYSIISALNNDKIGNYWTAIGPMDEVKNHINLNIYGIRDDFLNLVTGGRINIELIGYGAENKQEQVEDERTEQKNSKKKKKEIIKK